MKVPFPYIEYMVSEERNRCVHVACSLVEGEKNPNTLHLPLRQQTDGLQLDSLLTNPELPNIMGSPDV